MKTLGILRKPVRSSKNIFLIEFSIQERLIPVHFSIHFLQRASKKLLEVTWPLNYTRGLLKFLLICLTVSSSLLFFNSCIKADADPEKENPVAPAPSTQVFKWTPTGQSQVTADSSHYYNSFTTIFAFKTGTLSSIEINLSALSVGTYSLSSTTGNALSYVNNNVTYNSSSGSVSITSSADNKLSGKFNCTFTGTLSGISGEFVDVHAK